MIDLEQPFVDTMNSTFKELTDDRAQRQKIVRAVMDWLENVATKKPVPDLPKRIEDFRKDMDRAAEGMRLVLVRGKLVVKADGSAEGTLRRLRLGTAWFVGYEDINDVILAGVTDETRI